MAIIYVDMDGVLANFKSGMEKLGLPEAQSRGTTTRTASSHRATVALA